MVLAKEPAVYLVNSLEQNKDHVVCATVEITVTPQYRNKILFLAINGSYTYNSITLYLPRNELYVRVQEYIDTLLEVSELGGEVLNAQIWFADNPMAYEPKLTTIKYCNSVWTTESGKCYIPIYLRDNSTNAKLDLLHHLKWCRLPTIKCADMHVVTNPYKYRVHLPMEYTAEEYDIFLRSLSHIYYYDGRRSVDGVIWYEDGSWSSRDMVGECAIEEWIHSIYPNIPIYLSKEHREPIPTECESMLGHWYIE